MKDRNTILEDTILLFRKYLGNSGIVVDNTGGGTTDVATETTLQAVLNALQVLESIVNNGNTNSIIRYNKDGNIITVKEDTTNPNNNQSLPVKITSTSGDINITAGDLNVQLSHTGSNFDSIRIGDGDNLLIIDSDGNITVKQKYENVLNKYQISRVDETNSEKYYGFVSHDNSWYIMKINNTGNEYTYVNGNDDFITNWNNRMSLTYNEFNNLIW